MATNDSEGRTTVHPEPEHELVVKTDAPRKSAIRQNYLRADGMGTVAAEDYDPAKHGRVIEESDEQFIARTRARIASSTVGGHPPTTIANLQSFDPARAAALTPPAPVVPLVGPAVVGQPVATVPHEAVLGTDGKPIEVRATAGTHLPGTTGLAPGTVTGTTVVQPVPEGKDDKPSPEAQLTGAAAAPQGTSRVVGTVPPVAPGTAPAAAAAPAGSTAAQPAGSLAPPTFSSPGSEPQK